MSPSIRRFSFALYVFAALFASHPSGAESLETQQAFSIAEVEYFLVIKAKSYIQESAAEPESEDDEDDPWFFSSQIGLTQGSSAHEGTLLLPNGNEEPFLSFSFLDNLILANSFATEEELHEAYPFGIYTFHVALEGAEAQTATLNLAEVEFPSIPHILNFVDLQGIDPDSPVTIEWSPFVGATAADYIILSIGDNEGETIFETSDPREPDALDATSTSIEIPAGSFQPGRTYEVSLTFARITDINSGAIPGAIGMAGLYVSTDLEIWAEGIGDRFQIITPRQLPAAVVGEFYELTLETTGGVSPLIWVPSDDDIPAGIELNGFSGKLSGIPTTTGSFTFTILAFDGAFQFVERTFTLLVLPEGEEPEVPTNLLLTEIEQTLDGFVFNMSGATTGMTYTIEASTDLAQWVEIHSIVATSSDSISFTDSEAANHPRRFYRVRME